MGKPHRSKKTAVGVINRRILQAVRAAKEDQQINKYIKQMMAPPDKVIALPVPRKRTILTTFAERFFNWWKR